MPTYEYVCTSCGNAWEEMQKISEDPIQVCPKCSQSTAKRQISGGNFILKGGGWYADLYSSTKKSSGSSDAAKSEGTSTPTSESKTESKPDPKPTAPAKPDTK
ncbi:MAG: zinc ribbon domain-containing protein [Labilithrix sp.]|nr:zinc ribbon domain-containing protein [Labilithrix sp.]MCW5813985.1 zinc ribbon domain-containing protein [Labilithrix sp.]